MRTQLDTTVTIAIGIPEAAEFSRDITIIASQEGISTVMEVAVEKWAECAVKTFWGVGVGVGSVWRSCGHSFLARLLYTIGQEGK
jgi:hypothetical protein